MDQEVDPVEAFNLVEASVEGAANESDVQGALLGADDFATHAGDDDGAFSRLKGDPEGGGDSWADETRGGSIIELGDQGYLKLALSALGHQCVKTEAGV